MKINKLFIALMLLTPALFLQSCLKDDADVFDKPYSERMTEFLDSAQSKLINAPYGWAFEYYPDQNLTYGGVTYLLKFNKEQVTARYENNPDDGEVTSLYKLKENNGPTLSFDTNNKFLHLYATPAEGQYQGMKGDFEFVIDSIGDDVIKVHGNRSLNTMYLRKLTEEPTEYLEKMINVSNNMMFTQSNINVGGKDYQLVFTDLRNRQVTIMDGNTEVASTAYNFTDKGIRLYETIDLNGTQLSALSLNLENGQFSGNGVTGGESYLNLNSVADIIGSLSANAPGSEIKVNVPYLDKLTFTSGASWVHLTKSGNLLTITIDANPDPRKARGTKVNVSNGLQTKEMQVKQVDINALLGTYDMTMKSNIGNHQQGMNTVKAVITREGTDAAPKFYLTVTNRFNEVYRMELIYLEADKAFLLECGQLVYTRTFDDGVSYYMCNTFAYNKNGDNTGGAKGFYDGIFFTVEENGTISASLNGPIFGTTADGGLSYQNVNVVEIVINAFQGSNFKTDKLLGWWDKWSNMTIVKKQETTTTNARTITSLPERMIGKESSKTLSIRSLYLNGQSSQNILPNYPLMFPVKHAIGD